MKKRWLSLIFVALTVLCLTVPASANEGIVIDNETIVLHPDDKGTSVHTIYHAVNTSSSPQDVSWQLPDQVSDLQILVGQEDLIVVDNRKLQRRVKLAAGADFTVVYRYRYDFPKGSDVFTLPFTYPAQQLQILMPEENKDITLKSPSIQNQGPMDFQGKSYIQYLGNSISSSSLDIEMQGEQKVPRFHSKKLIDLWKNSILHSVNPHLLLAIFVVIIGIGVWLAYDAFRKRRPSDELLQDEEERRFMNLYRQNQLLFTKLTDLQRKHDAGDMDEEQFAKLKAEYKEKIVNVQLELKQFVA